MIGVCKSGKTFKFDREDFEKISKLNCFIDVRGGVQVRQGQERNSLARLLVDMRENRKVKFRNKDSTDCRKKNLFYENIYTEHEDGYLRGETFIGDFFKIDKEDYELLSIYVWHVDKNGYLITKIEGKSVKMHRMLFNLGNGEPFEIDHINREKTDNRKSNLRVCTRSENCRNKTNYVNKPGVVGVYQSKSHKKYNYWIAQISVNGNKRYLGCFKTLDEAKQARRKAEIEMGYNF